VKTHRITRGYLFVPALRQAYNLTYHFPGIWIKTLPQKDKLDTTNLFNIWMDMRGALPELVHGQVYKRWLTTSVGSSQLNWFALILYKELTGLALLRDAEKILLEPEAFSDIKIARLKKGWKMKRQGKDSPWSCSLQIIKGSAFCSLCVWDVSSWRSFRWSLCSAKSCWMYHLEHFFK